MQTVGQVHCFIKTCSLRCPSSILHPDPNKSQDILRVCTQAHCILFMLICTLIFFNLTAVIECSIFKTWLCRILLLQYNANIFNPHMSQPTLFQTPLLSLQNNNAA